MSTRLTILVVAAVVLAALASPAAAQYSTVTSPFNTANDSFFEQFGVNFGFNSPGFSFQQNSFGSALPPFGKFDPNAGASLGFGFNAFGGRGFIQIAASQGSRRSMTSTAPSVTLANGIQGGIFDTTQTPFVISVIPVVGEDEPAAETPLREKMARARQERERRESEGSSSADSARQSAKGPAGDPFTARLAAAHTSSAGQPAESVAQIRRQQKTGTGGDQREARELLERGRKAEADGKAGAARVYYQQGAQRASGELKTELLKSAAAVDRNP